VSFWSGNTTKYYSRDDLSKYPDIISPPSHQTAKHSKASDDNRAPCNPESKNVPMSRFTNFRVTKCESGEQTCTHSGTCWINLKSSLLNMLQGLIPPAGDLRAARSTALNVLGNMTYPCNNTHPNIWAARPHHAAMSVDASNIKTNLVICFLDGKCQHER
jgi:hypothetical protein